MPNVREYKREIYLILNSELAAQSMEEVAERLEDFPQSKSDWDNLSSAIVAIFNELRTKYSPPE